MKRNKFRHSFLFLLFFIILVIQFITSRASWSNIVSQEGYSWFIDIARYSKGAHGMLSCESCHGDMKRNGKTHPDLNDTRSLKYNANNYVDKCKKCHKKSYLRYQKGLHAKISREKNERGDLKSQNRLPPTCADCHDVHYGRSHMSRTEIGVNMTEVCGSCHIPQKITYLKDFHGKKAVYLKFKLAPYCSDCHGAHENKSLKDKKNALMICQRCHPKADVKFAEYFIHPTIKGLSNEESSSKSKKTKVEIIKAVTTIMTIIVIVVVAFFYGHSFLWFLRELHEKLRKH